MAAGETLQTTIIVAVFVEPGTGYQRRPLYSGPLSALRRLIYAGGKLSIQFGADLHDAKAASAISPVVDCVLADADTDLSCDTGQRQLAQLLDARSEFKFTLQAGLAVPLTQISASNDFNRIRDGANGSDEFTDCDSNTSTVSARTEKSPLTYNTKRGVAASAKWAAIGMQEVAGVIESSSSEEQQQPQPPPPPTESCGDVTALVGCGGGGGGLSVSETFSTSETVRDDAPVAAAAAAAAAAAIAATVAAVNAADTAAASEAEYLRFLYSDAYSTSESADDTRSRSQSEAACPTEGTNFYSPDSNVTSPICVPSARGSGYSSQSEAPNE